MPFRLYVVPIVLNAKGARVPKYFGDGTISGTWAANGYGEEPWTMVGADLSGAEDTLVAGKPDVDALPFNLTPVLTNGQVTAVRSFLEGANIPAGWVSNADTWNGVVRGVLGMFAFLQRYESIYGQANGTPAPSIFLGGITLDTTFGGLPAAVQTAILATAVDQGISTAGLTANITLRIILRSVADRYSAVPFNFNGTII